MGAREYWDRMLVYFGIAEEPELEEGAPRRGRRADSSWDEWEEEPAAPARRAPRSGGGTAARSARVSETAAGVGVVPPRTFNDAQTIADQFKRGLPVIVNLQQTDSELAKRLIDFASGLTYGLDGGMQRIADKVFLLTPPNVEVSAEERAAMVESGFFNQS
jgi:cell division inhibitor SepF